MDFDEDQPGRIHQLIPDYDPEPQRPLGSAPKAKSPCRDQENVFFSFRWIRV
jgi:hypothetical protein